MAESIIECVANCSEGRKAETIQALADAINSVKGVSLLDRHHDNDHHRCVFTFVGIPDAVAQAAFALVKTSTELIDLRQHAGQHPRIGATDVLPFIPLDGETMYQCVELAKKVGKRIGDELRIPVFLYEEACNQPFRKPLEVIRRGGLSSLAARMKSDPAWSPDFGPAKLHPSAGAIAVGARHLLIAFNIVLDTNDLTLAQAIAKTIRTSGGGLPAVKALGLELKSRGLVQVSMNLTNFHMTPLHVVFEAVRTEAERRGVSIANSELVGLIPQEAVTQAVANYLKCESLASDRILETRLRRCQS
ncbi:glutamate formimidoyltransferase [Candidatus Nitronereus thalassa]|uniref:glutamate formimidoyltransferase n=1 Tax=Candidatus Nitronereus thalassa TaxID=3020898 RepID=A0ABU3K784_9BACT|nr:glutamate formimidoyltransferase [Candidatus Nitronereus thalassa]MDT7042255.1 glutamate formimidoyltransferase [Candidatus Nitronereus thalassa]